MVKLLTVVSVVNITLKTNNIGTGVPKIQFRLLDPGLTSFRRELLWPGLRDSRGSGQPKSLTSLPSSKNNKNQIV